MDEFNFYPESLQPPAGPVQRYPVKIIFQNQLCGYYLFGRSNEFEIYFDVKFENRSGSRLLCLMQTFNHEDQCREWLCKSVNSLIQGQNLNYSPAMTKLYPNPDPDSKIPYLIS